MNKLAKYLKPFAWMLVCVFVLLFVQALCDLNLPNYMSNIVNVGIQQNGVQRAAPDKIAAESYNVMTVFMTEPGLSVAEACYEESDGVYTRKSDDPALDAAFEDAAYAMINTLSQYMPEDGEQGAGLNMDSLAQLAPALRRITPDQIAQAQSEAAEAEQSVKRQYGIALVEGYYSQLGLSMVDVQRFYIIGVGWKMILIALIGGVATVLVGLLASRMAAGAAKALRRDLFARVESFSQSEVNKFGTASLITRTTNDIQQVQMVIQMGTRMILYSPIMGVGGIIMALRKSASMSWVIALAVIVLIGFIVLLMSFVMPKFKIMQSLIDKLNLVAREHLSGLMVIRAFGTREYEEKRFDAANADLTGVNLFVNRVMSLMGPVMTLISSGVTLMIVWVGAHQIAESAMQVGDMMAFMQYAMQIIMSFLMLSMMFVFLPRAAVSMGRVAAVLDTEPGIVDPEKPENFDPAKKGVVRFDNVSFMYEGAEEYALRDISFTAEPGKTTAIIGSTGSGKSTIANLILRFFDATSGAVYVDGQDVRKVKQADLRQRIGYVPQKGVLISGTIASNLRYGNVGASDDKLREVASVAQSLDFIEAKEGGFDAPIAQGGDNVSGGQKQRLSIARALCKDAEIYIFDDSFSALDFKTDSALRRALGEYDSSSTIIIVAQRVSTILSADQILVLDKGRIAGAGTHRELLASCPEYGEIARSQLSEEELA